MIDKRGEVKMREGRGMEGRVGNKVNGRKANRRKVNGRKAKRRKVNGRKANRRKVKERKAKRRKVKGRRGNCKELSRGLEFQTINSIDMNKI